MRKFFLVAALGMLAVSCMQKSNEQVLLPGDMETKGKEIVISLADQNLSASTEITTPATDTLPAVSQPVVTFEQAAAMTLETPTNQQIQQALQNIGLYQGAIDGVIGKKTKEAIKVFQENNNLVVDGKVGKKTWEKLAPYLSKPSSFPSTVKPSNSR